MRLGFHFYGVGCIFGYNHGLFDLLYLLFCVFIGKFNNFHNTVGDHACNSRTFDGLLYDEEQFHEVEQVIVICILSNQGNKVFLISNIMLHMLKNSGTL